MSSKGVNIRDNLVSLKSRVDLSQKGNRRVPVKSRVYSSNTKENVRRAVFRLVLQSVRERIINILWNISPRPLIRWNDKRLSGCPMLGPFFCLKNKVIL